jgi:hypothetical protein
MESTPVFQRGTTGQWFALKPPVVEAEATTPQYEPAPSSVDLLADFRDMYDGTGQSLYFDANGVCVERTSNGRPQGPLHRPPVLYARPSRLEDFIPSWGLPPTPEELQEWDGVEHYVDEGQGDVLGDPDRLPQGRLDGQDFTAIRIVRGNNG